MESKKLIIAIDGYSSCGKSTLAQELANSLNYIFIDSGAMYRAVTLYCLRKGWVNGNFLDKESIIKSLDQIQLDFSQDDNGVKVILLNSENCEQEIRKSYVAAVVSKIAEIKEVREKLVEEQQRMGERGGIVMDGRDIGTVVFPNADIKLFLTATIEVRVERRLLELQNKGIETTKEEVRENLIQRDLIDSNRKESPLKRAEDAIVLDNSLLTREEQLQWSLEQVQIRKSNPT